MINIYDIYYDIYDIMIYMIYIILIYYYIILYIYLYYGILFRGEKKEILPFATTWMDL